MLSTTALRMIEQPVLAGQAIVIASVSLIPIAIAPMTIDVARHMVSVNRTQVRDPFDRTIVATAQALRLPLAPVEIQGVQRPASQSRRP